MILFSALALAFHASVAVAATNGQSDPAALDKLQVKDEKCALIAIANAKGKQLNPKDPAFKECEEASKDVCNETKSLLGNTINRGKLSGCQGPKLAAAGYCAMSADGFSGSVYVIKSYTCSRDGSRWTNSPECQEHCARPY
jgi:hypothetical protein